MSGPAIPSSCADHSPVRGARLWRQWISRHPLVSFYLLAFVASWSYELICIVAFSLPFVPWQFATPVLGPTAAALTVTALTKGRTGVVSILRGLIRWRVGLRWYLIALIGVPMVLMGCSLTLPGARSSLSIPDMPAVLNYLAMWFVILVIGGPLTEELGWRSFALPLMQQRFNPVLATLLLGSLWALWHMPLSLIEGYNHSQPSVRGVLVPFLIFFLFTVAISFLFTWVFNNTHGSGWVAVLLHTPMNASLLPLLLPGVENSLQYEAIQVIVFGLIAVVLVITTRGRLGYTH